MSVGIRRLNVITWLTCVVLVILIIHLYPQSPQLCPAPNLQMIDAEEKYESRVHGRNLPLIFIGGFPRSGTSLMRAMLDAHSSIRCGEETQIIPRMLEIVSSWNRSISDANRLKEAGITQEILDDAVASFILKIILNHGPAASRFCNKDPFTLIFGTYLSRLFPNAKFILMVRDGRAVTHSIVSRGISIAGIDMSDYRQILGKWSSSTAEMWNDCKRLGEKKCLVIKYEDLVVGARQEMEKILQFLGIEWESGVLHHEEFINKPGGISLSEYEKSNDQVLRGINSDALNRWVGKIPEYENLDTIAPMLRILRYVSHSQVNLPKYEDRRRILVPEVENIT